MKTLCPTWDQTFLFDDVQLTGRVDDAAVQAPKVVVEVFDWDARVCTHDTHKERRVQTVCFCLLIYIRFLVFLRSFACLR